MNVKVTKKAFACIMIIKRLILRFFWWYQSLRSIFDITAWLILKTFETFSGVSSLIWTIDFNFSLACVPVSSFLSALFRYFEIPFRRNIYASSRHGSFAPFPFSKPQSRDPFILYFYSYSRASLDFHGVWEFQINISWKNMQRDEKKSERRWLTSRSS